MKIFRLGKKPYLVRFASEKAAVSSSFLISFLSLLLIASPPIFERNLTQSEWAPFLMILALFVSFTTLINTTFGLSILVFSMLLSPEIDVAQLPQRAVSIRVEDFLIGIVFFTWFAKMAIVKEIGLIRRSILNQAILIYIGFLTFSTLLAAQETQYRKLGPWFFLLKYAEYFVIFFMFFNNVTGKKQVQRFLIFFLITGLCVCLYALSTVGKYNRLGAPFEGDHPEPGSLGGYLLVFMSVLFGMLFHSNWPRHRVFLWVFLFLSIITLVMSTSRGALIAFIPLYLTVMYLTPRKRVQLVAAFLICGLIGYHFVPPRIIHFTLQAFRVSGEGGRAYNVGGREIEVGPSGEARVESWKYVFTLWRQKPFFGHGVTGVGIVDSQFVRTLGEVGILGLLVFIWLLSLIFKVGFEAFRSADPFLKGLGASLILANTSLIAQGFTANSYIIVRIMEPFWLLVAVTLGLTQLSEEITEKKEDTLKVA